MFFYSHNFSKFQPDILPKKSANAWKSKREERFDINAPVKDEEEAKHEVHLIRLILS